MARVTLVISPQWEFWALKPHVCCQIHCPSLGGEPLPPRIVACVESLPLPWDSPPVLPFPGQWLGGGDMYILCTTCISRARCAWLAFDTLLGGATPPKALQHLSFSRGSLCLLLGVGLSSRAA